MSKGSLTSENLAQENIDAIAANSIGLGTDSGCGLTSNKVFRYGDPEILRNHVKEVINGSKHVIKGIKDLERATEDVTADENVSLRKGQIIFGTVSVAQARNWNGTILGAVTNMLAPLLMAIETGEPRKYAYLHAAIYAGKFNGKHYVIQNGGGDPELQHLGMVSAKPLDEAFEKDARFFVISPPLDSDGKSTRYLVLQRALACLGTFYHYHLRSINCEVFAMTLMHLRPTFEPVQLETLKPSKGFAVSDVQKSEDKERFLRFHQTLVDRLSMFPTEENSVLTLDYYLNNNLQAAQRNLVTENCNTADKLNKSSLPWWYQMMTDYAAYKIAKKMNNVASCEALVAKGLNKEN